MKSQGDGHKDRSERPSPKHRINECVNSRAVPVIISVLSPLRELLETFQVRGTVRPSLRDLDCGDVTFSTIRSSR